MERITKQAKDGYIFTQTAEVPIEQRAWGRVIDTTQLEQFHEVPIAEFEKWQKELDAKQAERMQMFNNKKE